MSGFFKCAVPRVLGVWLVFTTAPRAEVFADPLSAGDPGKPLDKAELARGGVKWSALKGVVIGKSGATAEVPAGAHFTIPVIAGKIRLQADVSARGSGFTGLALGRGNLSANFWNNLAVMVTVMGDRYNVFTAGKEMIADPAKGLLKSGEPNHIEFTLDTVARVVTLSVNGRMVLEGAALPAESRVDDITAAGFRFHEPVTAGVPVFANFKAELESVAAAGLVPVDLAAFFVAPGQEATLRWRVASRGPSSEVPYVIRDYGGANVAQGEAALGGDGIVIVRRAFARGYSEIVFPEAGQTFGVVALEPHEGPADPFFSIDAGLSWLELDSVKREALVKIAARGGISMARERLGVGNVTSGRGKYDFETGRGFDSLRKNYADGKIGVLEILDGGKSQKPGNFPEMAAALTGVADHWDVWGAAEAGNEPDLQPVPASEYLPMVKTMSYALANSRNAVPLVAGVFATIPPGPYFETCQANGMLEDSDIVSFHSYDRATGVEAMVGRYRAWLKGAGKEAMPLWHTECGWPWVNGPARPPVAQDADSAMEISGKAVESMACGVARQFPFVLPYYEEGLKNFSMMGREVTPLRSMAAYVNCIRLLGGKSYLGDLAGLDASVKLARVFGTPDGAECVAVLYTGKVDPAARILFPVKIARAEGADGRSLAPAEGSLPLPDGMAYVILARADVLPSLRTDTPAMKLYQIGKNPSAGKRRASPLVLQFLSDLTPSRPSSRRYLISRETAGAFPLNVRVHNLSPAPIEFTPELVLPGAAGEKTAKFTVPAMGSADLSWTLDVSGNLDIARTRMITVTGTAESGIQPLPLAIPVVMEGSLEQHLKAHPRQRPLPVANLPAWQQNIAGHGKAAFSVGADGAWRMDMKFSTATGSWAYPKFTLPEKIDPAKFSGILLRSRILKPAGNAAMIAGTPGAPSFWVPDLFPADGDWHVVYIPFAEFKPGPGGPGNQNTRLDPAAWQTLSIGLGSKVNENAIEVSHLVLVGGGEG